MLAARVEQVAGAGLDRHRQPEVLEPVLQRRHPRGQPGRVRVQVMMVEGEGDRVVPVLGQERERVAEPVVAQPVGVVAIAQPAQVTAFRRNDEASGSSAAVASAAAVRPAPAVSAAVSGIIPPMPAATIRCWLAGLGSLVARAAARPIPAAYSPSSAAEVIRARRPGRHMAAVAAVTAAVAAPASGPIRRSPPSTSLAETIVMARVWPPTTAAAGSARLVPPGPAASRTSRVRQAAMATGPAGVPLSSASYAHTVPASAAVPAIPPPAAPRATPAAVSATATPSAARGVTRPDGMGRSGRSLASSSRSATSLAAIPA